MPDRLGVGGLAKAGEAGSVAACGGLGHWLLLVSWRVDSRAAVVAHDQKGAIPSGEVSEIKSGGRNRSVFAIPFIAPYSANSCLTSGSTAVPQNLVDRHAHPQDGMASHIHGVGNLDSSLDRVDVQTENSLAIFHSFNPMPLQGADRGMGGVGRKLTVEPVVVL